MSNEFIQRTQSTYRPRTRATFWQGRLVLPPTLNARSQRIAPAADSARVAHTAKQANASDPSAFIPSQS